MLLEVTEAMVATEVLVDRDKMLVLSLLRVAKVELVVLLVMAEMVVMVLMVVHQSAHLLQMVRTQLLLL